MTPFSKTIMGSVALAALALGACSKQTDLSQDTNQPVGEVAANMPSATTPPPADMPAETSVASADTTTKTIADVAATNSQFSTLLTAAKAAGLDGELSSPGPITVFAPTDAAFAALPPGKLDELMKPENKSQLAALLKHHIVSGKVTSTDLRGTTSETAMNGTLAIDSSNPEAMKVADANVVGPDITTSNGVIHTVDKVLIPAT
ncbi:MAG: fasciclin domain-containing protein [Alphaproteobacteria bacterium]